MITPRRRRSSVPQSTPEGHLLVSTRYGRFWRDPVEGVWREYETPEEMWDKILSRQREQRAPFVASTNFNPFD